jgi:PIN domain nuclease of toxin-antitoxin system
MIETFENDIYVSVTSWFEISVKISIEKLELPDSLRETISKSTLSQIETIGITENHTVTYGQLPVFDNHKDPFDRMILATALTEGYALISADPKFSLYNKLVQLVW